MHATTPSTVVTSAEFIRQFGRWQDEASARAIFVTHHGRRRLAVVSAARYQEMLADTGGGRGDEGPASVDGVLDQIAQGFVAFAPDLQVTAINRAACAYLRVTADATIGRPLADRLPGLEDSVGYAHLVRAVRAGTIAIFDMPSLAYPDRWLSFQTFPWRDGAACLFRDITDETQARRLADTQTATLAALTAHAGIGRARLSARGTFVQIDEPFARLAGFSPDGLLRARLTDIMTLTDRPHITDIVEAILTGGPPQACDAALLLRSGDERPVRVALAPLHGLDGVNGAVVVLSPR